MLNLQSLQSITFANKNEFEKIFQAQNSPSCEISFANLMMWSAAYKTQYLKYKDALIFYSPVEKMIYYPLNQTFEPKELYQIIKEFTDAKLCDGIIYDVPQEYLAKYPEYSQFFKLKEDENNFDYIYENQKIVELSGAKLRKKRNLVKQFLLNYPEAKFENIDKNNLQDVIKLAKEFNKNHEFSDFLVEENQVLDFVAQNFFELSLNGIALVCNNQIIGFSIYSFLNNDYADIHFEKCTHEQKGASQFLTKELAGFLAKKCKYMNREQDLGNLGIRQAKHSLDPAFLYKRVALNI